MTPLPFNTAILAFSLSCAVSGGFGAWHSVSCNSGLDGLAADAGAETFVVVRDLAVAVLAVAAGTFGAGGC